MEGEVLHRCQCEHIWSRRSSLLVVNNYEGSRLPSELLLLFFALPLADSLDDLA